MVRGTHHGEGGDGSWSTPWGGKGWFGGHTIGREGMVWGTHHREGGDAGHEAKHILVFFHFLFVCLFVCILVGKTHISANFKGHHLCQMLKSRQICFSSMTEKKVPKCL